MIRTKAIIAPRPPYEADETVNQILDILREKTSTTESVSGYPARVFANLDDPPAPIEWLPVLESAGLLERSVVPGVVKPVHGSHAIGLYSKPNQISAHLWDWFCHHLESKELVNWVIDRGSCLHPDLSFAIDMHLRGASAPGEPFKSFWRALVYRLVECAGDDFYRSFLNIKPDVVARDAFAVRILLGMLVPRIVYEKSFDWGAIYADLGEEVPGHAPFSVKVSIGLSEWEFEELRQVESYPDVLAPYLPEISSYLSDAMGLLALFGKANAQSDNSYWDIPSIDPHAQNNRFNNWVFLVEICRDSWLTAWDSELDVAQVVFAEWRTGRFPVFRRLALFAAANRPVLAPDSALELLTDDDCWWLWSIELHREKYRLLAAVWPQLSPEVAAGLEASIRQGPPRRMYKEELGVNEWREIREREIWLHLSKLESFGRDLSDDSAAVLQQLSQAHPQWVLQPDDRDEFVSWMESGTGHATDSTTETIRTMEVAERIAFLQEENREFHEGRVDVFRSLSQEHPDIAMESLAFMSGEGDWDPELWHAALMGLASGEQPCQEALFTLMADADEALFRAETWVIAYWLRKAASRITPASELEQVYWRVFDRLFEHSVAQETDLEDNPVDRAINHPLGILVESLLDRLGSRVLKRDQGLSDRSILVRLEQVLAQRSDSGLLGITILFSRLHYFHSVDRDWCRINMVPLLDWADARMARVCWLSYLWTPRITVELAADISVLLVAALDHANVLRDQREHRATELFGVVCLEYPDIYTPATIANALASSGADGYAAISNLIWRSLRIEKTDAGEPSRATSDSYWEGRVAPFIQNSWSQDHRFRSEKRSQNLALG